MSHPVFIVGVSTVRLYTADPPQAGGAGSAWAWVIGACALGLAVSVGASWTAWRDRRRGTPEFLAFAALMRRLAPGKENWAEVQALAALIGAAPVALVLCESTYVRALEEADRRASEGESVDPVHAARRLALRVLLFG